MTIPIRCPACGARYDLDDSDAGQQVECACGQLMAIPEPARDPAHVVSFRCPRCHDSYQVEAELAGEEVECACGQRLVVPLPESAPPTPAPPASPKAVTPPASPVSENTTANEPAEGKTDGTADSQQPKEPALPPGGRKQRSPQSVAGTNSAAPDIRSERAAPAPESNKQPGHAATASTQSAAGRLRQNKKPNSTLVVTGLGFVGMLLAVVVVYIVNSGPDTEAKEKNGVAANEPSPIPSAPVEPEVEPPPPRTSLADRMQRAQASAAAPQPETEPVAKAQTAESEGDLITADSEVGSANPYAGTNANEYIALDGSQPVTAATAPATSLPPTENVSTPETVAAVVQAAPPIQVADGAAKDSTESEKPAARPKRILFVPPQKTLRDFDRAAKESLRAFAELRGLKEKTSSGEQADLEAWQQQLAVTGGTLQ